MDIRSFLSGLQVGVGGILLVLTAVALNGYVDHSMTPAEASLIDDVVYPEWYYEAKNRPDSLPDAWRGQQLWRENICGSCHASNMKDHLTGPALGGVTERWADYPREDLYAWVRNSQRLIGREHPRAVSLWNNWAPVVMSGYPDLEDEEIEDLLAYIEAVYGA